MIPFLIVKTSSGFSYLRRDAVIAVNAADPRHCAIVLASGVTIAADEPAEDVVARLEAEAEQDEAAETMKEHSRHGHVAERD